MVRPDRSPPIFVSLLVAAALASLVPSFYGAAIGDFDNSRVFFYCGLLFAIAAVFIGIAVATTPRNRTEHRYLLGLVLSYFWLPAVLALPMVQATDDLRLIDIYFDMASALTTTGAPIFAPGQLADTVHLWRATVGWFGGLLIWITALAVLAPLNLGGFEVSSDARPGTQGASLRGQLATVTAAGRLRRAAALLIPIYVGLTLILALALTIAGERPLHAVMHAMSTLSTSGISAVSGPQGGDAGVIGEVLIALFFVFALTRRSFSNGFSVEWPGTILRDREVRLAVFVAVVLPSFLFMRHWLAAYEGDDLDDLRGAFAALWGAFFTVLSFLTTTGFVSESWAQARSWSGLPTPGLILAGLVIMGGGVATTAGGLKLLRIYALYKHGVREIDRLIHPHSVAGAGRLGRRIRREGAFIAWVFFMLLLITVGAVTAALAMTGLAFEEALILALSAIATAGPLASVAGEAPISYMDLGDLAKFILVAAMIIGRMETLVFIAVLNPTFWRT
ncbi:TrkH family potassium uptake protein [Roseicyclus sp.]|uniref:TrkH family potassium uptake protein n=1 Tax=Roseicyclus sp. TaxID=1914329 RepID=UPI003F6D2F82